MNKTVFDLYCDYKRELWSYTGEHYEDELLREWYEMLVADPSCMIYPIVRFGKSIGFVILQTINCDIPKYIIDAYVMPEYRKQGYMTLLLDSMSSQIGKEVCLYVIKSNYTAREFWKNYFSLRGYEMESGDGLPGMPTDEFVDFWVFRKKG